MKDLTKGSPSKVMISFAIPVALGNIFQLCYSLADTRVVGSTLGEAALAAVGATTSISTLFIGFLSGLTNGFALLIARQFGAGDKKGVTRYGAGCLLLGCITSVLLTFICVSSLPFILRLLNVPEALMGQSTAYIRAVLLGLLATMLYNGCASILRAVGDTTAPLLFLLFAAALNVALDLLFILKFGFGVAGAAWATVLSQSLSAIISLVYMFKRYPVFRFKPDDFKLKLREIKALYTSGLSMAAMMSLVFFGTLSLQCAINTFGQDIIVAHTAARKITEFFMLPFSVMGVTMATYCGQNMGAGRKDRIRTGICQALILTWIWSLGMILLSYTVAPWLIWLVTGSKNPAVLSNATWYLKTDTLFLFCSCCHFHFKKRASGNGRPHYSCIFQYDRTHRKSDLCFPPCPHLPVLGHYYGRTYRMDLNGHSTYYKSQKAAVTSDHNSLPAFSFFMYFSVMYCFI